MTVEGAERLKAELQRLKSVERPAIIQAIAEARSHGDLSENADYDAAKERQGFVEGRIAEIEHKLAGAQVIDPAEVDGDGRVVFGATVEIEDLDSGDVRRWQIVGEDEADIKHGKISITSPIARALTASPKAIPPRSMRWRPAVRGDRGPLCLTAPAPRPPAVGRRRRAGRRPRLRAPRALCSGLGGRAQASPPVVRAVVNDFAAAAGAGAADYARAATARAACRPAGRRWRPSSAQIR
jgi:transcription elongation factor GreA